MSHVFLSYSRKDRDMMQVVRDELRRNGFTVWTDETLTPGTASWRNAIESAIEDASVLVIVMSPDAKKSEWVERELSYAATCKVPIFPVLARGTEQNAVPFELSNAQWVDIRQDRARIARELVPALRVQITPASAPSPAPHVSAPSIPRASASPPLPAPVRPAPRPAAPSRQMRELFELFKFDADDLAHNREGKLSRRQRIGRIPMYIIFLIVGSVMIGGVCFATTYALEAQAANEGVLSPAYEPSSSDRATIYLVTLVPILMFTFLFTKFMFQPTIYHVTGTIQLGESLIDRWFRKWTFKVNNVTFQVLPKAEDIKAALGANPSRFRIYYLKEGQGGTRILSLEPWNDS